VIALMVALGAAVGAPARYLTDRAVQSRHRSGFPWGTATVNVAASLVLGVIIGAATGLSADVQALVATGFCGALSTFSTFSFETVRLWADGRRWAATINVVGSVVIGTGAGALGYVIGQALVA
jgi:fluoride exporter